MSRSPHTVLLVDPDPHARAMIAQQLHAVGCAILEAESGADALAQLDGHAVRLVLTELYLPAGADDCLVRALRKDTRYRDVRIAAHTHRSLPADREWAFTSGADAYLIKPTRAERIRYVVGRLTTDRGITVAPSSPTDVPMRRDSLDLALNDLERGVLSASCIIFAREWWLGLPTAQRADYRKRAKAARVSLRSDARLTSHFVEVRGRWNRELGLSSERPESPYRR